MQQNNPIMQTCFPKFRQKYEMKIEDKIRKIDSSRGYQIVLRFGPIK